ncbi:HEPN domain-containing protein [Pseudomonas aeruginosa]|uniref:HEPN domain-containing protein n=1 Tax=Pseudomonas aeruginosa TaxID=287 RepID=UPI000A9E53DC|nr:HEPN domain-containing protein [Pseudomonas aeruginosa]MCV0331216.1 hypothetical protein [Pseudomonas aeruginosa]HCF5159348.1 hypothetical protein [Pseudomonas aeruginosa]HCF7238124.1 hypothetical protein [Pseudomonas aeruginosa]HEJ5942508.1 hypothetical protein [Pseudomonas aeruginosa]
MHPMAEKNLQRKILGLLNNTTASKNYQTQPGDFDRIKDLAKEIFKLKGEWISKSDCEFLLFDIVSEIVSLITKPDSHPTLISEHISVEEHANRILSIIQSIPREETIYYPLPAINSKTNLHIKFKNGCEILKIDKTQIENPTGLLEFLSPDTKTQERYYIAIKINGYLGRIPSGPGHSLALSKLKQILERGQSLGFLNTSLSALFRSVNTKQRVHSWWSDSDSLKSAEKGKPEKQRTELPLDLSHYVQRIDFAVARGILPQNSMEENNAAAQSFIDAVNEMNSAGDSMGDRIRAASEWLCNSYIAEDVPMKLLQACIGLESIYGEDSQGENGLTESLSDRCAYSIGTSHKSRKEIKDQFKSLYKLRSKIVHGVNHALKDDDLNYIETGRNLLKASISKEIWLSRRA